MSITRTEALVELLAAQLKNTKLGILVRSVEGIEPNSIVASLVSKLGEELSCASSGYPRSTLPGIEDAVEWRGHADKAGRMVVFVRSDAPKMHSLADLDVVTPRDVARSICALAETKLANNDPHHRFWKTLSELVDTIPLGMLEDYVSSLQSSQDPDLGDELWRIGFLPDRKVLDAAIPNLGERLAKNRNLLSRIGQLSEESRKRLGAVLVTDHPDAAELKKAYRQVMAFFRRGDAERLSELDYEVVERLLEAGKRPKPPIPDIDSDDDDDHPPEGPIKGEQLVRTIADQFIGGGHDVLSEIADHIQKVLSEPDAPAEVSPESFGGQSVQFKPSNELLGLNKLIGLACLDGAWGGHLTTSKSDIKSAVKAASPDDFVPYRPTDPEQGTGSQSLFDLVRALSEFLEGGEVITTALDSLLEHRSKLLNHLSVLLANPLALFGGRPEVVENLNGYLNSFGQILHAVKQNYANLTAEDQQVTEFVCGELLRLDVIHIQTPTEWKALLTPLHPFHLWRFREIINALGEGYEHADDEIEQLRRALPRLPHLLHFVVFSQSVGAGDIHLPQSGAIELLPTYENKTNRYLGLDGLESLPNVLSRWVDFAPYSEVDVKLSVVDPPDIPATVLHAYDFLRKSGRDRSRGISLNIYLGRGQDPTAEMLRLDLVNEHEELGQLIAGGRLRIRMESFESLADLETRLGRSPSHVVFAFDQSHYQLGNASRAKALVVSPLVVTYEYTYSKTIKVGEIAPSSEAHDGLFGDYHFFVERAARLPAGQQLRLRTQASRTVASINGLLESGATRWLAVADRVLTPYAPTNAVPLTEHRVGSRELGVWASKDSYAVQRLVQLLRRYNLNPSTSKVAALLKTYGHIAANGILSLPLVGGSSGARDIAEKGLLGTLVASTWYQQQYPDSLVAALDSSLARDWLCKRHPDRTADRADLVGIRIENEIVIVEPIEVKSRKDDEAAHVSREAGSNRLVGKAIDQLESMIELLEPIFGLQPPVALFTSARREALKYQLFRECFRDSHSDESREKWFDRLKLLFANSGQSSVEVRGLALHVNFEESGLDESATDPDRPLRLVRLKTPSIQEIVSETTSPVAYVDRSEETSPVESEDGHDADASGESTTKAVKESRSQTDDKPQPSEPPATNGEIERESMPITVSANEVDPEEAAEISRSFLRACNAYRVTLDSCDPKRAILGPTVWRFYFRLKAPQTLSGLRGKLEDIGREMGRSGLIVTTIQNSRDLALDIPRAERAPVPFVNYIGQLSAIESIEQLPILIGVTPEGEHIQRDLSEQPHLLVGGTTGSGKSVFLYSLILALLHRHPGPSDMQLMLSSSKAEDFIFFNGLPQVLTGSIIADASIAAQTLQGQVVQEMQRRGDLFQTSRCRDIKEYNRKNPSSPVEPLVVIVDEFADLADQFGSNRAAKDAFYTAIRQIAQAGRSRGIHLVLCTQRPSADLVPTNIRTNLNARVALSMNDGTASRMILDENGAENLQRHGDMLFKENAVLLRAQGYFVTTEDIEDFLGRI